MQFVVDALKHIYLTQ